MPSLITSDRNAIPAPLTGLMVFNETTNDFNFYDGTAWQPVGGGGLGAGIGLTVNGPNLDLGSLSMPTFTTFKGASDNMFELYSSAAAGGTKTGFNLRMQDSYTGRQYEIISRKSDAIPNSASSDFLINTLFSTGGGYIEAFKIDGGSSDVVINGAKTTASPYGNIILANGNVGINTTTPGSTLEVRESFNGDPTLTVAGRNISLGDLGGGAGGFVFVDGDGSGNVGISTLTPTAKLHVAGTVKIVDGTQGAGKVLTSNASGLASWTTPSGTTLISNPGTRNLLAGDLAGAIPSDRQHEGQRGAKFSNHWVRVGCNNHSSTRKRLYPQVGSSGNRVRYVPPTLTARGSSARPYRCR